VQDIESQLAALEAQLRSQYVEQPEPVAGD